jgi:hypothetical protein
MTMRMAYEDSDDEPPPGYSDDPDYDNTPKLATQMAPLWVKGRLSSYPSSIRTQTQTYSTWCERIIINVFFYSLDYDSRLLLDMWLFSGHTKGVSPTCMQVGRWWMDLYLGLRLSSLQVVKLIRNIAFVFVILKTQSLQNLTTSSGEVKSKPSKKKSEKGVRLQWKQ